ncbi:hypothetical protein EXN66_Car021769 [Channa argus]|uniref:Uncharacterized protein n=1 Tax=Channa argus TaxID=215402 RepID=A0A6G1QV36_CHAAH|nr:hypothetical protein EXN66_Car021769 [Channa argus]
MALVWGNACLTCLNSSAFPIFQNMFMLLAGKPPLHDIIMGSDDFILEPVFFLLN